MSDNYYNDLREFIEVLDRHGLLYRWQRKVNKDSELMPLMRLQYRGRPDAERQAFLYENVTDGQGRRYGIKVLTGVYAASRRIAGLGMGCKDPGDIYERWRRAVDKPIDPVVVESGPVHEEVHVGAELEKIGLSMLPAPVEEPGFSGDTRVTGPFITQDSENGVRNVGMYSGHFRPPNRLLAGIGPSHHAMLYHYPNAKRRRETLPVAIVLGALPDINYVAAANLPYGLDELSVAGGIRRRPVELVRCKTVPLEVPAEAEIVIEGEISTEELEAEQPFSDFPGYLMVERHRRPVVKLTAITHRHNATLTSILVGLPPSESNGISRTCREMGGGWNWWVIRMRNSHPSKPWQALQAASGRDPANKVIIAVDEDIDPKDPDMVMWAMSFAMQPHRDTRVITGRVPLLDPSAYSLISKPEERSYPPPFGCSGILIDATRKGPYPPVGLPKQEYMERALQIWKQEELPPLALKNPWYGYALGLWNAEDDAMAEAIARGEPVPSHKPLKD